VILGPLNFHSEKIIRVHCVVYLSGSYHAVFKRWPAPGSEDTELGVLMELEVGHGETEVYSGVQA
jgi:hypothetical protein